MVKTVNFRVGRGRATERRKAFSARGLLDAMKIIGMTDDERRAVLIGGSPDSDLDWQKAYELDANGQRTGRWQWMNERGERDEFYPGRWLDAGDTCQPPRAEGRGDE